MNKLFISIAEYITLLYSATAVTSNNTTRTQQETDCETESNKSTDCVFKVFYKWLHRHLYTHIFNTVPKILRSLSCNVHFHIARGTLTTTYHFSSTSTTQDSGL